MNPKKEINISEHSEYEAKARSWLANVTKHKDRKWRNSLQKQLSRISRYKLTYISPLPVQLTLSYLVLIELY